MAHMYWKKKRDANYPLGPINLIQYACIREEKKGLKVSYLTLHVWPILLAQNGPHVLKVPV
jgi:hypothetical protein